MIIQSSNRCNSKTDKSRVLIPMSNEQCGARLVWSSLESWMAFISFLKKNYYVSLVARADEFDIAAACHRR